MTYVLRIIGLATGDPTPIDGEWVLTYDPNDAPRGFLDWITTTPDPDQAKQFPTLVAATEEWRRVCDPPHDRRPDGRPNRPLTAFSVTPQSIDQARRDKEALAP